MEEEITNSGNAADNRALGNQGCGALNGADVGLLIPSKNRNQAQVFRSTLFNAFTSPFSGMPSLATTRLAFNSFKIRPSQRSLAFSFTSSIFSTTRLATRRAFSIRAESHHDLFNYTSGRWVYVLIHAALHHTCE